jgi:hypothetical protein
VPAAARHAAPLAADPGPLPGRAPRPALPAPPSPWRSTGLVLAGAALVVAGTLGGWGLTRSIGGQSPLTAQNVTTAGHDTALNRDPLGFTIPVPTGWTRHPGADAVAFVSGNGTEDLTVARAARAEDAETVPGVEVVEPAGPSAGNTTSLTYRTDERTSWRRIVPGTGTVWVITLTVPRSAAGSASQALFESLAGGFSPTA